MSREKRRRHIEKPYYSNVKNTILELISSCGVVSIKAIRTLGYSNGAITKSINEMKNDGWIKKDDISYVVYQKFKSTGRVKRKKVEKGYIYGFKKEDIGESEELSRYVTGSMYDEWKSQYTYIKKHPDVVTYRALRQSEIKSFMKRTEGGYRYLTTKEIKRAVKERMIVDGTYSTYETPEFFHTRSYGVIQMPDEIRPVYCIHKKPYSRLLTGTERTFAEGTCYEYGVKKADTRIVFMYSYKELAKMIATDTYTLVNGKNKGTYRRPLNFVRDTDFKHTWILDLNKEARKHLELLLQPQFEEYTRKIIGINEIATKSYYYADAIQRDENTGRDVYIYNFLIPDPKKLQDGLKEYEMLLEEKEGGKKFIRKDALFEVHTLDTYEAQIRKLYPLADIVVYGIKELQDGWEKYKGKTEFIEQEENQEKEDDIPELDYLAYEECFEEFLEETTEDCIETEDSMNKDIDSYDEYGLGDIGEIFD